MLREKESAVTSSWRIDRTQESPQGLIAVEALGDWMNNPNAKKPRRSLTVQLYSERSAGLSLMAFGGGCVGGCGDGGGIDGGGGGWVADHGRAGGGSVGRCA